MEKNVGSVDIEELKRARESLNQELGIDSDPDMYANYNPNREPEKPVEDEPSSDFSAEEPVVENTVQTLNDDVESVVQFSEGSDGEISATVERLGGETIELSEEETDALVDDIIDFLENNNDSENQDSARVNTSQETETTDFSAYDSFAEFEVANDYSSSITPKAEDKLDEDGKIIEEKPEVAPIEDFFYEMPGDVDEEEKEIDEISENVEEPVAELPIEEKSEEDYLNPTKTEGLINFDDFELPSTQPKVEEDEETPSLINVNDTIEEKDYDSVISEIQEISSDENQTEDLIEITENDDSSDDAEVSDEESEEEFVEEVVPEQVEEVRTADTEMLNPTESVAEELTNANEHNDSTSTTEIIGSYRQLEELLGSEEEAEALLSQLETEEEPVEEEPKPVKKINYAEIAPYKFVDVISTDAFTNSNKLSYVFGKNENDELVFGNLRDSYNIGVFGKETGDLNNLIHSIILSLILKNSVNEVNFVICDSKADSKFEVYNKSSYMYFNRIAKTNKEILDTLIEVSKELEERYKLLAEVGVKSIEQYNTIAKNDNLKPLPYLITVFNNYSKSIQLTNSDKINACLHQILKFGRIVGLYLVIVANTVITSDEINYNLPTRLSFMAEDVNRSLTTLGVAGAESLPTSADILYSSVELEKAMHLKVATLSKPEIELLIENIEE